MTEQSQTDEERRFASQLRSELDAAVRPFDPAVIVQRAEEPMRPVLRVALVAATVAAAVIFALAATQLPGVAPSIGVGPEPTQEPSPPPSVDAARGQLLPPPDAAAVRELAERYMLDDPPHDVEFERYISPEEYAGVMVPCLTEQGIPATALPDGGVGFGDLPEEEWVLQREAMYRCNVRFPIDPMFDEPLSEDQLRRLYAYLVEHLTPCLEDEGYATTPPPPVEEFIASYSGGRPWSPWPVNDPRLQDEAEWYRLNEVCPQSPSVEYLYGDALIPDGD